MDIHEAPTRLDANNWTTQKLRQAGWHATARANARKSVAPVPGQLQVGFVLMIRTGRQHAYYRIAGHAPSVLGIMSPYFIVYPIGEIHALGDSMHITVCRARDVGFGYHVAIFPFQISGGDGATACILPHSRARAVGFGYHVAVFQTSFTKPPQSLTSPPRLSTLGTASAASLVNLFSVIS